MTSNGDIGEHQLETLANATGEGGWLTEKRRQALAYYNELSVPEWRRTDGRALLGAARSAASLAGSCVTAMDARADVQLAPGVIWTDLLTATREYPELVEARFGRLIEPNHDKLVALHYALVQAGAFLYVPAGCELSVPIRLEWGADSACFFHTLIVLEPGARASVVVGEGEGTREFGSGLVEMWVGDGAVVQYVGIQNTALSGVHYSHRRAHVGKDAQVEWLTGVFGGRMSKDITESRLLGNGSESANLALLFGSGRQHIDVEVTAQHQGEYTSSDILVRSVFDGQSRGICRGRAEIDQHARSSSAYQRQNALLLSREARIDAIPELLINENQVQAGHAATVGQVAEEQLFFLMSRGLPRSVATLMVVEGFLQPVLDRIPVTEVREGVQQLIRGKMSA